MRAPRVTFLALGLLLAVTAAMRAENVTRPAIFSDVPPRATPSRLKLEAPPIVRAPLPLSEQVRSALTQRAEMAAAAAPATSTRAVKHAWTEDTGDAILMDRVVVLEQREKKIVVEDVPSFLGRIFTTGVIWENHNGTKSVNWGLAAVKPQAYGTQTNAPRISLSFSWSW